MNTLLRDSSAHLFVRSLAEPRLSPEDEHHLDRVLRIDENEPVTVCDGIGSWAVATWSRRRGVQLTSVVRKVPEHPFLSVACAIPKGDKGEFVVQKLTELGIDRIIFFECERSIVRWDDERRVKMLDRYRRIAHEAAMQSRRLFLPSLEYCQFADTLDLPEVVMAEPGGGREIDVTIRTVVVGPEGGFSRAELEFAMPKVSLSKQILRVETAAMVAGAMLAAAHDTD
jgi:16S rRNA (uracil1498-N3)-methyltransferase